MSRKPDNASSSSQTVSAGGNEPKYERGTCFHPDCTNASKYEVLHCGGRGHFECCAGHFKWMKRRTTDRVRITDIESGVVVWQEGGRTIKRPTRSPKSSSSKPRGGARRRKGRKR